MPFKKIKRNQRSRQFLRNLVFPITGICSFVRRTNEIYYRNRFWIIRENDAKLFRAVMFWRHVAKNGLSAKMDGLLLGLLDDLVRCSTVLHRQNLKRTYDQANDSGRIFVWQLINVGQLHHFGKLFDGASNDRKSRFFASVSQNKRHLFNSRFNRWNSPSSAIDDDFDFNHDDCFLCDFLWFNCLNGFRIWLSQSERKRKTACFNSIIVVRSFDHPADFAALFKKFNVKPSKRQHHCGISDRNHLIVNCLQFSERCQKFLEIIKKRQPNSIVAFIIIKIIFSLEEG